MKNHSKDLSFQIVLQKNKLVYISENFFHLFECYQSLEDFLQIHKDISELFDDKARNRKYLSKDFFTKGWHIQLLNQSPQKSKRIVMEFKDVAFHYELSVCQNFLQQDQYIVVFKDISKIIFHEKKVAHYLFNQKRKISKLTKLAKHKDKLSLMGEMMENITHQWKQPLSNITFIASSIQLKKELETLNDSELNSSLENILNNIDYMSQTIHDFRIFLNEEKQKKVFDINNTIKKTAMIIQSSMQKASVKFHVSLEDDCYTKGYENELIQAIINILNNGIDALKVQDPYERKITLKLAKVDRYNSITIEDNAGGIPQEIIDQIFEHYFTTKGERGTGIGLFITKEIVEKHLNGIMNVSNTPLGALFEIKIPRYEFNEIDTHIYKD